MLRHRKERIASAKGRSSARLVDIFIVTPSGSRRHRLSRTRLRKSGTRGSHDAVIRVYDQMGHANRLALAQLSRELRRWDLTKQRK